MDIFGNPLPLAFVVIGSALILAEAGIPGAHFIVLGVAMLGSGLVGLVLPGGVYSPFILAGLTLVFGGAAFWVYKNFDLYGSEQGKTKDSTDLVGKEGLVVETVTTASGQVELHNVTGFSSTYSARCESGEIPVATPIVVTDGSGGNVVTVRPVSKD